MPLSNCRICGKKVPNPYRPHHEKYECKRMKELQAKRDGTWLWNLHKAVIPNPPKNTVDHKILEFAGG